MSAESLAAVINSALDRYPIINLSRGEYEAIAGTAAKAALSPEGQAAQRESGCRGFVPRSGFGANRSCSVCAEPFESHPVRVQ
jgi:hypothetical protein